MTLLLAPSHTKFTLEAQEPQLLLLSPELHFPAGLEQSPAHRGGGKQWPRGGGPEGAGRARRYPACRWPEMPGAGYQAVGRRWGEGASPQVRATKWEEAEAGLPVPKARSKDQGVAQQPEGGAWGRPQLSPNSQLSAPRSGSSTPASVEIWRTLPSTPLLGSLL